MVIYATLELHVFHCTYLYVCCLNYCIELYTVIIIHVGLKRS